VKRKAENPRGWFDDELTKRTPDYKEGYDVGADGDFKVDGINQWPKFVQGFESAVKEYYSNVEKVGIAVLSLIARSLGLEPGAFQRDVENNASFLRLNYYPKCTVKAASEHWTEKLEPQAEVDGVLSVNKHTDAGLLTVLRQRSGDPSSLQVFFRNENRWVRINPVQDAFIINVGDCLQVWTNDLYQSPVHRVLANNSRERYSAPFFLCPAYDSIIHKRTNNNQPARYKAFTWGEFRRKRFEGDFEDKGYDEVQISQYAIENNPNEGAARAKL